MVYRRMHRAMRQDAATGAKPIVAALPIFMAVD